MNRLFVPLNTGPFEDFQSREKTFELRAYGRQYTEKHVYTGRSVELRKGYSGESLWGTIGQVHIGSLNEVLTEVSWQNITPRASSEEEARESVCSLLGEKDSYMAFEVIR